MKKTKFLCLLASMFLVACDSSKSPFNPNDKGNEINDNNQQTSNEIDGKIDITVPTNNDDIEVVSDEISQITDLSVDGISYSSNVFTISKAGVFSFKGSFVGQIYIEAGDDDDVEIELVGFTIKCSDNSPIFCLNANELKITAKNGTTNHIYDTRAAQTTDDDTQGKGAIYSKCDTKISGKGSLTVTANYNNGIHTTKDLKLKQTVVENSSLQVNSRNIALKGNDSVEIESGNIVLIASSGEGIKTEDSDISSKGNQRGDITITGGHVDIYSCQDGIEASHDVLIKKGVDDNGNETTPIVNIRTSNYSEYSGEVQTKQESTMYLRTTSYSSSYRYAVLFTNSDSTTSWANATYDKSVRGGRSTYYYFKLEKPTSAVSFKIYRFSSTNSNNDVSNADCSSNSVSVNDNYDTLEFSIRNSSISASAWSSYSSQSSGGGFQPGGGFGPGGGGPESEGNTNKADYSAKGIKADNLIDISAGSFDIKAYDDAIHANYGTELENSSTGVGDLTISGGDFSIYAADDALHADRYLKITGGTIDITNAYEGVEGNSIIIEGGYTKVYATDDGLNAANKASLNPSIEVKGGIVDVTVYGGDVDGIDSNGTFSQTGGKVITKGGNSQMSTGLDVDKGATISGGTFVAFGRTEVTPSTSSGISSYSLSGSYAVGNYLVKFADNTEVTVTTKFSYSVVYVYSDTSTKITITKI